VAVGCSVVALGSGSDTVAVGVMVGWTPPGGADVVMCEGGKVGVEVGVGVALLPADGGATVERSAPGVAGRNGSAVPGGAPVASGVAVEGLDWEPPGGTGLGVDAPIGAPLVSSGKVAVFCRYGCVAPLAKLALNVTVSTSDSGAVQLATRSDARVLSKVSRCAPHSRSGSPKAPALASKKPRSDDAVTT